MQKSPQMRIFEKLSSLGYVNMAQNSNSFHWMFAEWERGGRKRTIMPFEGAPDLEYIALILSCHDGVPNDGFFPSFIYSDGYGDDLDALRFVPDVMVCEISDDDHVGFFPMEKTRVMEHVQMDAFASTSPLCYLIGSDDHAEILDTMSTLRAFWKL